VREILLKATAQAILGHPIRCPQTFETRGTHDLRSSCGPEEGAPQWPWTRKAGANVAAATQPISDVCGSVWSRAQGVIGRFAAGGFWAILRSKLTAAKGCMI